MGKLRRVSCHGRLLVEAREAQAASVLPGWNFAAEFVEEIEDEGNLVQFGRQACACAGQNEIERLV